jgi:hypothetical protein
MLNALLDGTLPYIAELLDASLISIKKPGGGVRPIAIAEVWHRLAGLCAMKGCAAGMELHPLQVAVGVPGGSGCIGHALHAGMLADTECVTIQVDFRNAFNSLRRDAALASERACPSPSPLHPMDLLPAHAALCAWRSPGLRATPLTERGTPGRPVWHAGVLPRPTDPPGADPAAPSPDPGPRLC